MGPFIGIYLNLSNTFHKNVDDIIIPTNGVPIIVDNPSSFSFHDENESLTRVSHTYVQKFYYDF